MAEMMHVPVRGQGHIHISLVGVPQVRAASRVTIKVDLRSDTSEDLEGLNFKKAQQRKSSCAPVSFHSQLYHSATHHKVVPFTTSTLLLAVHAQHGYNQLHSTC
jgi:hypothetical protein